MKSSNNNSTNRSDVYRELSKGLQDIEQQIDGYNEKLDNFISHNKYIVKPVHRKRVREASKNLEQIQKEVTDVAASEPDATIDQVYALISVVNRLSDKIAKFKEKVESMYKQS